MYYPIDEERALDYVRNSCLMTQVFGEKDDLTSAALSEGNINLVFRVCSESDPIAKSVLIKQALPHSRRYPELKLPLDRARIEFEALQLEGKYCPAQVPRVYFYDHEMHLNAMEDMNRHIVMRYGLMQQIRYPSFASHLGTFLARTLFYTSDFYLSSPEKKALVARFINPALCKLTEDLIFTQPFIDHPNNRWNRLLDAQVTEIRNNEELRGEVFSLKTDFMCNAQALIHGDLHTGSIMVNQNETKVIDPEFAFFGPMGFDIGNLLANLVLSYASQEFHAKVPRACIEFREWLLESIRQVWVVMEREFRCLWSTEGNDQWPSVILRNNS